MKYDVKYIIKNITIENNSNQIYANNNCGFINKFLLHFIESNEYIMISLVLTTLFPTDCIQFYKFVCKKQALFEDWDMIFRYKDFYMT